MALTQLHTQAHTHAHMHTWTLATFLVSSGCCDKIPLMQRLNSRHLLLSSLGAGKAESKVLADSVPGQSPFWPSMSSQRTSSQRQDGLGSPPFLVRALILSWGSTFMTSANRNSFPKACLLIASHCGLGLQCKNSVGGHFHCITCLHTHTHTCTLTYVHSVSTHTHACTAFHVHTVPTYPDSHLHRNVHTCSHAYRLYV